ncbi:MAG: hypothetical protein WCW31_04980 [Patescibacteria group bacterium]
MDQPMKEKSGFIFSIVLFCRNHWAGLMARWRYVYWRFSFYNHPSKFSVCGKIRIRYPEHVVVGQNVELSEGLYINARDWVFIGDDSTLSAFVRINTGALPIDTLPNAREPHTAAPVHIGKYVWLATGVTVNPGVTIHDGVVVGAGAVVTHDLPPYTLCVGIPAKPIRKLPELPAESA